MSRYTAARFAAVNAASAISASAQASVKMEQRAPQKSSKKQQDDDDEEYVLGEESATSHKRKRVAAAADPASRTSSLSSSSAAAAAASSSVFRSSTLQRSAQVLSFPLLSDDEPNLHSVVMQLPSSASPSSPSSSSECVAQPSSSSLLSASFLPSSKFLFSLCDETRDRGSAKLAVVHVQLRQPGAAANSALNFTTSFKIDGRKSFSNAPFKKYYARAIHAAWFAQPTHHSTATTPLPNAQELTRFGPGRVLLCLSQRNGRPNGKGFTGVKHDPTSFSSKHPLLCLSSNSVEYYLSVFVNQTTETLEGESASACPPCWAECEVDVSARFDAGEVTLEPVSLPSSAAGAAAVQRPRVAAAPQPAAPAAPAAASSASSSSSAYSASTPSPTMLSRCSSTSSSSSTSYDRSSSSSSAAAHDSPLSEPVTEENSSGTPLLHDDPDQFMSEAAPVSGLDLEVSDASQFQLVHDDELVDHLAQQQQQHSWPLHHHQHESQVPAPSSMLRHSSGVCFPFEQLLQQQQQPQSSPFTSHFDELSSSSSSLLVDLDAPQSKRARLAVQTDSLTSHLPTIADMSWASSVSPLPLHFNHQHQALAFPQQSPLLASPHPGHLEQQHLAY